MTDQDRLATLTIVIVAPDLAHGGSVGDVALQHAYLLAKSYKVHLISRAVPGNLPAAIGHTIVNPTSWNWLHRFGHVPNELAFAAATRTALIALRAREPVDVLWCHGHTTAALLGRQLHGYPIAVVMTMHGDIFDRPAGTYTKSLTALYRWVTPRAYAIADAIHAISPHMGDLAMKRGATPERVHIVPHGVDAVEIGLEQDVEPRREEEFLERDILHILYVGSLLPVKGIPVLLRAAAEIRSHRVKIDIVGSGPQYAQLKALAEQLLIDATFHGHVSRHDLFRFYLGADLLCLPSFSEALPLVILEAMLCGLPVVASNTGGISTMVTDGVTGMLALAGDHRDFAASIEKAAASRGALAKLGQNGWLAARKSFSWNEVGVRLAKLPVHAVAQARIMRAR